MLRAILDKEWRDRTKALVARLFVEHPVRMRFEAALNEGHAFQNSIHYSRTLPSFAKRRRLEERTDKSYLSMKEALDWVLYLRIAAGTGVGVSLEKRIFEVGSTIRTFRRISSRLKPYIHPEPRRVVPSIVLGALSLRLDSVL